MASFVNQYQNRSRSLSEIIHAHVNDQRMKCATIVHYVYFCQTFVLCLFICYHCFVPIFMAHWICPSVFALSSYSFDHRLLFVLYFVHCSLSCELFFWSHFQPVLRRLCCQDHGCHGDGCRDDGGAHRKWAHETIWRKAMPI